MIRSTSRGGFELAINNIVVMVLGIVIVIGGIFLVQKITSGGTNIVASLTSQDQTAINQALSQGQLVAAFPISQDVNAGQTIVYGVGIQNRLSAQQTFTLTLTANATNEFNLQAAPLTLAPNQEGIIKVVVTPTKTLPNGAYTIIIQANENGQVYDSARFFNVNVK